MFTLNLQGQTISFKGSVKDLDSNPVPFASISLKNGSNSIVLHTFADSKGIFSFKTDLTGRFLISCKSLGFEESTEYITLDKNSEPSKVLNFLLKEKTMVLNEIVANNSPRVVRKKIPYLIKLST